MLGHLWRFIPSLFRADRALPAVTAHRGTCEAKEYDMIALITLPMFAAAGYSLIYLLGGGGLFGAFVIFIVAKMFGK